MQLHFAWDPVKAASNRIKHNIRFDDVLTVFHDPLAVTIPDADSSDEERWVTIGLDRYGQVCLVVHTFRETGPNTTAIRIISARRPTKQELRDYREGGLP